MLEHFVASFNTHPTIEISPSLSQATFLAYLSANANNLDNYSVAQLLDTVARGLATVEMAANLALA